MRPALYSNKEKILKWLGGATIKWLIITNN
jgi:hypothetical protein